MEHAEGSGAIASVTMNPDYLGKPSKKKFNKGGRMSQPTYLVIIIQAQKRAIFMKKSLYLKIYFRKGWVKISKICGKGKENVFIFLWYTCNDLLHVRKQSGSYLMSSHTGLQSEPE